jgi:hypothetical protein
MKKTHTISIIIVILSLFAIKLQSQNLNIAQSEKEIKSMIGELILAKTDSQRLELNNRIDKLFGELLKDKNTFNYPFDSLKNISKLKSEDGLVRIYNWNIPLDDGGFRYYAYIQHIDKKKKMDLFRLEDKSETIKNPEFAQLSDKNWYGALYYKILINTSGKETYYSLLGWDGNNNFTNKKMVESFYVQGKKLIFGPPIFKMEKAVQNRLIFEFGEQVKMMLRYDENIKMIVFDHLAPAQKKFEGQFMYYGPDLSQDGIKFNDGLWEYKPNLDLRNMEESTGKSLEKSY